MFEGHARGQVSTEYLVILAVVLVIALAVVFLVSGGSSGLAGGITESQSQSYWASTAPLSLTVYKLSGTTLDLSLNNKDAQEITIASITVDGREAYSTPIELSPGETNTVTITNAVTNECPQGSRFSVDLSFTYTKGNVSGLVQSGEKPIVGGCS